MTDVPDHVAKFCQWADEMLCVAAENGATDLAADLRLCEVLQFPIDYGALAYLAGRFDGVLAAEMGRRRRQLAHKAGKTARQAKASSK